MDNGCKERHLDPIKEADPRPTTSEFKKNPPL